MNVFLFCKNAADSAYTLLDHGLLSILKSYFVSLYGLLAIYQVLFSISYIISTPLERRFKNWCTRFLEAAVNTTTINGTLHVELRNKA